MSHTQKKLILFTRLPEAGRAKTRLIPALGAVGAATLQRQLTEHTLLQAQAFSERQGLPLEIHFADGDEEAMQHWLGAHAFKRQAAGSIGDRMKQAFAQAFADGMGQVVLIGTDCPGLNEGVLRQAFLALHDSDLVLGPAVDGGYYLIGLKQSRPVLFDAIAWGTASVLQQTLAKAKSLHVSQLAPLHDIDRPQDLVHFDYHPNS